jgi:hypothetical protein
MDHRVKFIEVMEHFLMVFPWSQDLGREKDLGMEVGPANG